jgi:UDP-N-acetylglucosamine 2-epimerase (non-hydrolysing)
MPEEINRLLTDQISRWCFIHSPEATANLEREGIGRERVFFVGNTMIDTLVEVRPRIDASRVHARLRVEKGRYLLATLHRPALVDGPLFASVMEALAELARDLPVVFPMHPRTHARLSSDFASTPGLHVVDPVGYVDFLALEAHAAGVLTDSGGVQEETTFLRVPCFTLRENTERPVTIRQGTNRLLGLRPQAILDIPRWLARPAVNLHRPDHWDGKAAGRVADVLALALLGPPVDVPDRETAQAIAAQRATSWGHGQAGQALQPQVQAEVAPKRCPHVNVSDALNSAQHAGRHPQTSPEGEASPA